MSTPIFAPGRDAQLCASKNTVICWSKSRLPFSINNGKIASFKWIKIFEYIKKIALHSQNSFISDNFLFKKVNVVRNLNRYTYTIYKG